MPSWQAIIFSETGLLVGFFLPGDSLLFGAGFLASQSVFDIFALEAVLIVAAIVGDALNYYVGLQMGQHVFEAWSACDSSSTAI